MPLNSKVLRLRSAISRKNVSDRRDQRHNRPLTDPILDHQVEQDQHHHGPAQDQFGSEISQTRDVAQFIVAC